MLDVERGVSHLPDRVSSGVSMNDKMHLDSNSSLRGSKKTKKEVAAKLVVIKKAVVKLVVELEEDKLCR